jgi:hypothetical protein
MPVLAQNLITIRMASRRVKKGSGIGSHMAQRLRCNRQRGRDADLVLSGGLKPVGEFWRPPAGLSDPFHMRASTNHNRPPAASRKRKTPSKLNMATPPLYLGRVPGLTGSPFGAEKLWGSLGIAVKMSAFAKNIFWYDNANLFSPEDRPETA